MKVLKGRTDLLLISFRQTAEDKGQMASTKSAAASASAI